MAVLVDKTELCAALCAAGFAVTAYLPGWHLHNGMRYDCRPGHTMSCSRRACGSRHAGSHRLLQPGIRCVLALDQRLAIASPADTAYRARLFRLHSPDDRELSRLFSTIERTSCSDTLRRQLAELVKTRHPAGRLSPSEIDTLMTEALGGRPALEYGAWAYYSWSNRLVHVLDESEFVELRTNRNTYKIAPAERAALATKRIGVVGLSVGQSVAVVLSLERSFGELRLADFDTLDLSNLNRLRAGVHDIGVPKVIVTAREIAEIDPYLHVECFFDGITETNLDDFLSSPAPLDLLVEECDSIDLKIQIRHAARGGVFP